MKKKATLISLVLCRHLKVQVTDLLLEGRKKGNKEKGVLCENVLRYLSSINSSSCTYIVIRTFNE